MSVAEMEKSSIVVDSKSNQVMEYHEMVCWRGKPWDTITIKRLPDGTFFFSCSDPEHGGGSNAGNSLEILLQGLDPEMAGMLLRTFNNPANLETLRQDFPPNLYDIKFR